jgi:UDP-3-O-[3-hydroxymyristoyl] glucosamine N-acyltransferase
VIFVPRDNSIALGAVANLLGGTLVGDPQATIHGVCSLDEQMPDAVAFSNVSTLGALQKVLDRIHSRALLIRDSLDTGTLDTTANLVRVAEPLPAMLRLVPLFYSEIEVERVVSPHADVHPSARIGRDVHIAAFCSIAEHAIVGDRAVLFPGVVLYPYAQVGAESILHSGVTVRERCVIGDDSVIQNGAVIGSDGFGYHPSPEGHQAVPQVGVALLGDRVDVGANTCVDRATLGTTSIARGVKVDNLAQIGHNVNIGEHAIVCGDVAIGGSTKIGKGAVLAGASSYADHLEIADGARFTGRAAAGHVRTYEKGDYTGYPARPISQWKREQVMIRKLPSVLKRLRALEKTIAERA